MIDNVALMRKAKMQLANKWGNAALGTLIYMALMMVANITYVGQYILYGPLTFGYLLFLGCLVDRGVNNIDLLFNGFKRFAETLVAGLLYLAITSLATMLLIVPGIIAGLGLSMTFFIMVDDPNISGLDALRQSWAMMDGHKWDLFCLGCRFIGWLLLALLTCGIGMLWLAPYMYTAMLNFYRQLRYGTF